MTDKEKLDAVRAEIHRLVDIRGYDREMANDLFAFMDSLPNEPVSEDLGNYINELSKQFPEVSFAKLSRIAVRVANWQKEKDKQVLNEEGVVVLPEEAFERMKRSLIELAEKEQQMTANTTDAMIGLPYENKDGKYTQLIDVSKPLPVGNNKIAIIFKED